MADGDGAQPRWVDVGPINELQLDPGVAVEIGGREIALFRHEGSWFGIDNSCPHAGGALAEGTQNGSEVTCPWHGWCFDVRSGECKTLAEDSVASYPVRELDGRLEVDARTLAQG